MKFKMAPNSLFAVLLRSPWWISVGIAVVFVAAVQALVPQEYRVVGSMGAFPFAVIGVVAFWRQWQAPSAGEAQALLDSAARMSWPEFEAALRQGFSRAGYVVRAGKGGADLALERNGQLTLVSARRWKAARHGEEALQPLRAAMRQQDAGKAIFVALGELSPQARRVAGAEQIELVQGDPLVRLLRR
jgi:restriction system protein